MGKYETHRADGNQAAIVQALRKIGVSVEPIGTPLDLLVATSLTNTFLMEVKDKGGKLSASQRAFIAGWKGRIEVVWSVEDALRAIGVTV